MLQGQPLSGRKLEDLSSVDETSCAEAHSPNLSISSMTDTENNPTKECSNHPSGAKAKDADRPQPVYGHLSAPFGLNEPEPELIPIPSARVSLILLQNLSFSLIELFFDKIHPCLPMSSIWQILMPIKHKT
jgi:hypothetical protein